MGAIKWFKDISSTDVGSCGGKGASLGELMRAGFPFADGFVLTIEAFGKNHNEWADAVYAAYDQLDTQYVAVRSSATKEDGVDDSFAGQFDTYLFVNRETLIEQIMECHKSIDSPRIIAYCESKGINISEIKVAVVIQKMINSEVAGVAFTVNPVTNNRDEIMMEGGFGLGEAVVSGMITPDNYIWSKGKQNITDKSISHQTKKLVLDMSKGGTIEESVESTIQEVQKLSDSHITELAQLSEKIEQHYGKPMDIEWALEDNKLYILQARPITTLSQLDTHNTISIIDQVQTKYLNDKRYRQRFDACPHFMSFLGSAHITTTNKSNHPWGQSIAYVGFSNDTADRYHNLNQLENTAAIITQKITEDAKVIDTMVDDYLDAQKNFYELCNKLKDTKLDQLSKEEIRELYKHMQHTYLQALIPSSLIDGFALTTDVIIANHVQDHLEKIGYTGDFSEVFVNLTSPIFHSFLQEEELDFLNLLIDSNNNPDDEQIKSHQQKYFWMQNNYTNDNVLEVEYFQKKRQHLQDCDLRAKQEEIMNIPHINREKKDALIEKLHIPEGLVLMLKLTDKFNEAQDKRKKMTFRATHYFSIILQEISNRTRYSLHQLKYSSNAEFDKIIDEKISIEELNKRIEHCMFLYTLDNEEVITDKELIHQLDQMGRGKVNKVSVLHGFTACKGRVKGKVCIVESVQDIHKVKSGDILVAVMTRPDYLPAMKKALAFITDEGGITCHAAIVAREMNKPCIIGTKIATQTLHDGDLVEVDAHNGIIHILEKAQKNIPREKVLQRNFPPFAYTSGAYYEFHGIDLGPVHWKRDREIMATYNVPQVFLIQDPRAYYTTNVLDILPSINKDFEKALDTYNQKIYEAVRISPGNNFYDLANINTIHKLVYGLMLVGFDLVIDTKSFIDKTIHTQDTGFVGFLETPWQKTAIQREQDAINTLQKYNAHHDNIELEQLAYDFGYIHQDYFGEARTVEKYTELLNQASTLISHMDESYNIDHLSDYEQWLVRVFKKLVYMYEEGRNAMVRCMRAIKETSKKIGIDTQKLIYMTAEEVEKMYHAADSKLMISDELLAKRKEGFVAHFDNGIYTEYTGKQEVEKFLSETGIMHFWDKRNVAVDELKGTVAFPGYAIGRARLVFDQKDANAVQEGEILISPMTQVEFLGGMRRCGAIVTDEGGTICHAAIVAREFGKPCILSAKDATSAIKNGDLVEVDANMGVVRIVEKFQDNLLAKARKKNRAGRWSLLSCYYFGNHYTKSLQEKVGISLEETMIIVHKGYSACYFLEEHKKKFGTHFAQMAAKDNDLAQDWSNKLMEHTDIILATIKELMNKTFAKEDVDVFLEAFYNYSVYHRIIKVSVDYLDPDVLTASLPYFEKARVYAEPVYENTEVYLRFVADALGKKYSIDPALILATSPEQFADILIGKIPDISVLQNQFESSLLYIHQGKTQYLSGDSAQAFEKKLTTKNEAQETITGQTAYPGKVQGRVRIVLDPKPDTVFERGDILVTGMTRPEYLPLVEKSAAFVTDAGGILSHAAITARELQKPCVIGTEVASKILKDGDIVEVDADNGTVKILEKSDKKKDNAELWQDYIGQKLKHMGIWGGIYPLDIGTWYPVEVMENLYQLFGAYSSSAVICDCRQGIPTQWVFLKQNGLDAFGQRVDEIRQNDPQGFGKLLVGVYDTLDEVKKYFVSQDIGSINNLSDADLAQRFVDYRSKVHKLSVYDQIVWRNEAYLDKQLHENIQSLGLQPNTEEYNKVLFALIMPLRPSTVMDEEQSVVSYAQSIQEGEIAIEQAAKELAAKFGWLPAFVAGDEWGPDHYLALLEKYIHKSPAELATESQKYVNHTAATQALIHEYAKQYNIPAPVLQICSDYALAIDSRNEAEYNLGFARRYLRPVCQTIAQRLGVSEEELRLLYEDEVPQCLRGEKNIHDILATRKGSYTAYCYDAHTQKSYTFDGDNAKEFLEYCQSTQQANKKTTHVAASKGVATGKARIVHGPHENDKVQPGDILITQSTTVDYLPAMKVCGAIITEVGGLTCHAAVVARELGVPCIVSYAGAMTEFKDGDIVEVDANTNQIRVIEKNKPIKREKVISRNMPILEWFADAYFGFNHYQIGPIDRGRNRGIVLRYKSKHTVLYLDPSDLYVTNIDDFLDPKTDILSVHLDETIAYIKKSLQQNPATTLPKLQKLNDMLYHCTMVMLMGYDLISNVKNAIAHRTPIDADLEHLLGEPIEKMLVQKEMDAMRAAAKNIDDITTFSESLATLEKDFGFLHQDYLGTVRKADDYRVYITKLLHDGAYDNNADSSIVDITDRYDVDTKWLITAARKIVYIFEEARNAMVMLAGVMKQSAHLLGISDESILHLTHREIHDRTANGTPISEEYVLQRKDHYAIHYDNGQFHMYDTQVDVEKLIQEQGLHIATDTQQETKIIKGRTANKGKATGKVKLVFNVDDANKLQTGEILVTTMTAVEFFHGIINAAAIVTDEGGVISHAAIVSREFNKPCIIATGVATQVLRDGDLIEVDADSGVIKIIKRA